MEVAVILRIRKWLLLIVLMAPLFILDRPAFSTPVTLFYHSLSIEVDPIQIQIGPSTFNTGVITLTLDPVNTPADRVIYDLATLTVESHVDLLVNAPLLMLLGLPPQKLHVDETGSITDVGIIDGELQPLEAVLNGGGVFGPGQFLSGWTYSNSRHPERDPEQPGIRVQFGKEEKEKGKLKSPPPDQQKKDLQLRGQGDLKTKPLPEPGTLPLVLSVLAAVALYWRRRSP